MTEICSDSEYDIILSRYISLRNQLVDVIVDKENLLKHRFFNLKTEYITKIGYLEYELSDFNIRLGIIRRKIEMLADNYTQTPGMLAYFEFVANREFSELLELLELKRRELDIAKYINTMDKPTNEEYLELNKNYKGLVKLLHPEINSTLTKTQFRLWEKGNKAYENGELRFLKVILKLANDESIGDFGIEKYTAEQLNFRINYFELKIEERNNELMKIQKGFPFNKEEFLLDDMKVKALQKNLKISIKEAKNILMVMEGHFLINLDDTRYLS